MTQRIRYTRKGNILTAQHYNQVIDGANSALEVLGPPEGRLPGTGSIEIEGSGEIDGLGSAVYSEVSRILGVTRVYSVVDSSFYVDIAYYKQVTFQGATDRITLVFST